MMEDHRHPTEEPWPLPRLAHPRRHTGFTMIPDGAGLAGRDVCKHTGTDKKTRRPKVSSHTYSQPRPTWPSTHKLGPGPTGPPAALARSVQEEGDREGRGGAGEVGGGHQEQMRTQVANPFSCPLLALEGLPGAGWQYWPQEWPLELWRHPLQ